MVIMQKLNRQLKVDGKEVEKFKQLGYSVVEVVEAETSAAAVNPSDTSAVTAGKLGAMTVKPAERTKHDS